MKNALVILLMFLAMSSSCGKLVQDGKEGAPGTRGATGTNGTSGADGATGATGANGTAGATGATGTSGSVTTYTAPTCTAIAGTIYYVKDDSIYSNSTCATKLLKLNINNGYWVATNMLALYVSATTIRVVTF